MTTGAPPTFCLPQLVQNVAVTSIGFPQYWQNKRHLAAEISRDDTPVV